MTSKLGLDCENMTRSTSKYPDLGLGACLLAALAACAPTGRYLGRLAAGPTYVNRGFGLVVPLAALGERWWLFDPEDPERGPRQLAPERKDERIDLDGDGMLRLDELTSRYDPLYRLVSKTSSSARIEFEVHILSAPGSEGVTARALFDDQVRGRAGNPTAQRLAIESAQELDLGLGRGGYVTSVVGAKGGGALRLALIEQPTFEAENGIARRQMIWVRLEAPVLRPAWVADYDALVSGILAATKSGQTTRSERW